MIRNLKALGLALAALFAFGAISASAASAQNGMLTSDGPTTLDMTEIAGEPTAFTLFNSKIECPGSTITGHRYFVTPHELISSGAEAVTLTPDYNVDECVTNEVGASYFSTITMNECDLVLHIEGTTGEADTYYTRLDIACPAGKSIIVDVYFSSTPTNENLKVCEVTVGPQTGLIGGTITNETDGHLAIHGAAGLIIASKSGLCGSTATSSGELDINMTVAGTNESGESTVLGVTDL